MKLSLHKNRQTNIYIYIAFQLLDFLQTLANHKDDNVEDTLIITVNAV